MPFQGRSLILEIGGDLRPDEDRNLKGYLRRVARDTGIGFRSVECAWKGQYASEKTRATLQRFAAHANHVATRVETIAADLPDDLCREEIDTLRRVAHRLRQVDWRMGERARRLAAAVGEEAYPEG